MQKHTHGKSLSFFSPSKPNCNNVENEVCEDIVKEFPLLKTKNECRYMSVQKCIPDDVPSTLLTKPVVKKVIC